MMRRLLFSLIVSVVMLAIGCSPREPKNALSSIYGTAPFQNEPGGVTFPLEPIPLEPAQRNNIQNAVELSDILTVEKFLKLEARPESVVSTIDSAVKLGDSWFIVDRRQRQVFQFHETGVFTRRVSRQGQGPGEYEYPYSARIAGDQLIVADVDQSKLLFYDASGNHIKSISTYPTKIGIQPRFFIDQGRLYTAGFMPANRNTPYAAIFDITKETPEVIMGFGKRAAIIVEHLLKPGFGVRRFDGFELIGDYIWSGSPYHSNVEFFDREGRFCGEQKPGFDGMQISDYEAEYFRSKERISKFLLSKKRNAGFYPIGQNLVLAEYVPKNYSIWDQNGNLIRTGIKFSDALREYLFFDEGRPVFSFETDIEYVAYYKKYLSESQFKLLKASGWNPEDFSGDNPYLVFTSLKRN